MIDGQHPPEDDNSWGEISPAWSAGNPEARGGAAYAELVLAQRRAQARLAAIRAPAEVIREVTARLDEISVLLAEHQASTESERWDGARLDLPGRGSPLVPPYVVTNFQDGAVNGHVTFSRFHLGGRGALHGGVLPLLFDDIFGMVANRNHPKRARTARLTINYRRVTPIGVALAFDASLNEITGRKRFVSGRLYDASGALCAEADALFVELLPGQP